MQLKTYGAALLADWNSEWPHGTKANLEGKTYLRSWATSRESDGEKNVRSLEGSLREIARKGGPQDLCMAVQLAYWPTPTAVDRVRSEATLAKSAAFRKRNANQNTTPLYLGEVAALTSWAAPSARDWRSDRSQMSSEELYGSKGQPLARRSLYADNGAEPTGSGAETASTGLLSPELSRWLMGIPAEWENCAPTATRSSSRKRRPSSKP